MEYSSCAPPPPRNSFPKATYHLRSGSNLFFFFVFLSRFPPRSAKFWFSTSNDQRRGEGGRLGSKQITVWFDPIQKNSQLFASRLPWCIFCTRACPSPLRPARITPQVSPDSRKAAIDLPVFLPSTSRQRNETGARVLYSLMSFLADFPASRDPSSLIKSGQTKSIPGQGTHLLLNLKRARPIHSCSCSYLMLPRRR